MRTGHVRATHCLYLNDRRELVEGEELVQEVVTTILHDSSSAEVRALAQDFLAIHGAIVSNQFVRDIYVASFSEEGDDLTQWRAYGGHGSGYALGLTFKLASDTEKSRQLALGLGGTMLKVVVPRVSMRERGLPQASAWGGSFRNVRTEPLAATAAFVQCGSRSTAEWPSTLRGSP